MKDKGLKVVTGELKQKIVIASAELTKYGIQTEQYVQNRMFCTNQTKFFERLENEDKIKGIRPGYIDILP